jgi:hypothetical protein
MRRRRHCVVVRLARDSIHGLVDDFFLPRGMDGIGVVWAGVSSTPGVTERTIMGGSGLNPGRNDPRGLAGIGPKSTPGWG